MEVRSNSRHSGETRCDSPMGMPGRRAERYAAAFSSCAGFLNENRKATAIASNPSLPTASTRRSRSPVSSGVTTSPVAAIRSRAVKVCSSGASGAGLFQRIEKISPRSLPWIV